MFDSCQRAVPCSTDGTMAIVMKHSCTPGCAVSQYQPVHRCATWWCSTVVLYRNIASCCPVNFKIAPSHIVAKSDGAAPWYCFAVRHHGCKLSLCTLVHRKNAPQCYTMLRNSAAPWQVLGCLRRNIQFRFTTNGSSAWHDDTRVIGSTRKVVVKNISAYTTVSKKLVMIRFTTSRAGLKCIRNWVSQVSNCI